MRDFQVKMVGVALLNFLFRSRLTVCGLSSSCLELSRRTLSEWLERTREPLQKAVVVGVAEPRLPLSPRMFDPVANGS